MLFGDLFWPSNQQSAEPEVCGGLARAKVSSQAFPVGLFWSL